LIVFGALITGGAINRLRRWKCVSEDLKEEMNGKRVLDE
jgi:hypothetical protein